MNQKTKKLTTIAMLCAMSYVAMLVCRIPITAVEFLKYEPKDVLITIGGFLFGPIVSFLVALIVAFVEMITVSGTGIVGCIMNLISSCAFSCTAAAIYKKKRTMAGAIWSLAIAVLVMTAVMLIWNYLITPIYMIMPRSSVASMLIPVFLPFNLIKGGLNMAIILLIYRPIVSALRRTKLIDPALAPKRNKLGIFLVALLLLLTCILFILVQKGIL
ncbi:MAG: ECF transporter S component [Ruminococcaceae bacterium]|nr:ECF transporter S component [Oscillospiraceae bacterium]